MGGDGEGRHGGVLYEADFNDVVEFLHAEFTTFGYRKGLVGTGPQK